MLITVLSNNILYLLISVVFVGIDVIIIYNNNELINLWY